MSNFKRLILVVLTACLVVGVGLIAVIGYQLWQFQRAVDELEADLKAEDTTAISPAVYDFIDQGKSTLSTIRPFTPVLDLIGDRGCVLKDALFVADELAPVADDLAVLSDPLFEAASTKPERKRQVNIVAIRDAWQELEPNIDTINTTLVSLQAERETCSGATGRYKRLNQAVDSTLFLLDVMIHVPWDEALADSSRWLILLNNSDEIRATGGFTTAFFDIAVEDGMLSWRIRNSYSVDSHDTEMYHPRAPRPMYTYMEPMRWWFRDANWSPDHPTAADMALRFYALDQGVSRPTGVITVNFSAIDTLVEFQPGLRVRGKPFNERTALDTIRTEWGADAGLPSRDPNRKDFLLDFTIDLANAMRNQLGRLNQARLGLAVKEMLQQRDVMIYTELEDLAAYLAAHQWDGALIPVEQDYFMPVDTNLGYNKVTPHIDRRYVYEANLQDVDAPQAHVELHYTNQVDRDFDCTSFNNRLEGERSYYDRMYSCFWNYARVYFPAGSEIAAYSAHSAPKEWFEYTNIPNPAHIDALEEPHYEGVGTMLVVPIGESRDVTFDYHLPPRVLSRDGDRYTYALYVQNQAGSIVDPAITIRITLPADARDIEVAGDGATIEGTQVLVEGTLLYDQELRVSWTGD